MEPISSIASHEPAQVARAHEEPRRLQARGPRSKSALFTKSNRMNLLSVQNPSMISTVRLCGVHPYFWLQSSRYSEYDFWTNFPAHLLTRCYCLWQKCGGVVWALHLTLWQSVELFVEAIPAGIAWRKALLMAYGLKATVMLTLLNYCMEAVKFVLNQFLAALEADEKLFNFWTFW